MKRLLVVDGNSIINRAFFGVRPLTTKSGKHTNAIFGMVNIAVCVYLTILCVLPREKCRNAVEWTDNVM